jgi:hypothetical protein
MLIGVIADSHNRISDYDLVLQRLNDVEIIIHAGDLVRDATDLGLATGKKVIVVSGNCELSTDVSSETEIDIEGWELLITHGHQYGVKAGLDRLLNRASKQRADVIIFGHTHIPHLATYRKILVLNPGSIALPRGGSVATYGIIKVQRDYLHAAIHDLNQGALLMQSEIKR